MENTDIVYVDMGNMVVCDYCNKDYTNLKDEDGILFGANAVCPDCQKRVEESAKKYHEEHYIQARCPKGMSFADWVRKELR